MIYHDICQPQVNKSELLLHHIPIGQAIAADIQLSKAQKKFILLGSIPGPKLSQSQSPSDIYFSIKHCKPTFKKSMIVSLLYQDINIDLRNKNLPQT